jgi:hypothetical protein
MYLRELKLEVLFLYKNQLITGNSEKDTESFY